MKVYAILKFPHLKNEQQLFFCRKKLEAFTLNFSIEMLHSILDFDFQHAINLSSILVITSSKSFYYSFQPPTQHSDLNNSAFCLQITHL